MPAQRTQEVDTRTLPRVIAAASIGNFVEWFDFAAYGFLATILTREFFPSGDPTVGLLKTFAVFAVSRRSPKSARLEARAPSDRSWPMRRQWGNACHC